MNGKKILSCITCFLFLTVQVAYGQSEDVFILPQNIETYQMEKPSIKVVDFKAEGYEVVFDEANNTYHFNLIEDQDDLATSQIALEENALDDIKVTFFELETMEDANKQGHIDQSNSHIQDNEDNGDTDIQDNEDNEDTDIRDNTDNEDTDIQGNADNGDTDTQDNTDNEDAATPDDTGSKDMDMLHNPDDKGFSMQEDAKTLAAGNTVDLSVSDFNATSALIAYEPTTFSYVVRNASSQAAYNVKVQIIFRGRIIGTNNIGQLNANSSRRYGLEIEGVPAGKHEVELEISSSSNESNWDNNFVTKEFEWITSANAKPDLTSNMTAPTEAQGLRGEDNSELRDEKVQYITAMEVQILNQGTADAIGPFSNALYFNGQEIATWNIEKVVAGGRIVGEVTLEVGGFSDVQFEIKADTNNRVAESNESNNNWTGTRSIKYCTHRFQLVSKGTNSNVTIWIEPEVLTSINQSLENLGAHLGQWNAYSDNVRIVSIKRTSRSVMDANAQDGDVKIVMGTSEDTEGGTARTKIEGHGREKTVYCNEKLWARDGRLRSLTHEIGHTFGLGHPNEDGDTCDYNHVMWQTQYQTRASEKVTYHDGYNVIAFN